jgi:hypothetical protein
VRGYRRCSLSRTRIRGLYFVSRIRCLLIKWFPSKGYVTYLPCAAMHRGVFIQTRMVVGPIHVQCRMISQYVQWQFKWKLREFSIRASTNCEKLRRRKAAPLPPFLSSSFFLSFSLLLMMVSVTMLFCVLIQWYEQCNGVEACSRKSPVPSYAG